MAQVKMVILSEDPSWFDSRTITAEPGAIELAHDGRFVFVKLVGNAPRIARLRQRLGERFALARWDVVVYADEDKPPKK
jgi:hypothetical protein